MSEQDDSKKNGGSRHEEVMERYRALDLTIDERGTVQLTGDQQRRIFAYGYFAEGQCPSHIKTWKQCLEGIELIQGMGVPALSNLRFVYMVGDNLTAMHRLCLAACEATGELERNHAIFVDKNNETMTEKNVVGFEAYGCVVYVRRKGRQDEAIGSFTMDDAKAAGLDQRNKNYVKFGRDMLWHRASMRALQQQFADILGGVKCKELEEYNAVIDDQGQPATTPDGNQIFQRRLQRLRESEQAFARLSREK